MKKMQTYIFFIFYIITLNLEAKLIKNVEKELATVTTEKKLTLKIILNRSNKLEYHILTNNNKNIIKQVNENYSACSNYFASLVPLGESNDHVFFFQSEISPSVCSGDASDVQIIAMKNNKIIYGPQYSYVGEGGIERYFDSTHFFKDQTINLITWTNAQEVSAKKLKIFKKDLTRTDDPFAVIEMVSTWKKDHFENKELINSK